MKCNICMLTGVISPAFLSALGAIEIFALAVLVPLFLALFFLREKLLARHFADRFQNRLIVDPSVDELLANHFLQRG